PGTSEAGVSDRYSEGLINWLRKVDAVVLVAAKKECLVFSDRPTHFEPGLKRSDLRLRSILRVGKELVGIESFVAKEKIAGAVKLAGAAAGRNRYRSAAIASFFGSRIVRGDLEFLHIVRGNPVQIANRIGNR